MKLKFGLSEKHTKFEKIFIMVLTNQLNVKTMRKIFSNYVCFSKSPNFTLLIREFEYVVDWARNSNFLLRRVILLAMGLKSKYLLRLNHL